MSVFMCTYVYIYIHIMSVHTHIYIYIYIDLFKISLNLRSGNLLVSLKWSRVLRSTLRWIPLLRYLHLYKSLKYKLLRSFCRPRLIQKWVSNMLSMPPSPILTHAFAPTNSCTSTLTTSFHVPSDAWNELKRWTQELVSRSCTDVLQRWLRDQNWWNPLLIQNTLDIWYIYIYIWI